MRRGLIHLALAGLVLAGCTIEQDLTPRIDAGGSVQDPGDDEPGGRSETPQDPLEENTPPETTEDPVEENTAPEATEDPVEENTAPATDPEPEPEPEVEPEPGNRSPVARADDAATDEDRAVTVPVLGNDTDPDGDPLTVSVASNPGRGDATVAGGAIRYVPRADVNGTDRFTYAVSDGRGGRSTATVTVTIRPVNDAPVAVDDRSTTPEDTAVVIDVLANDTDVDGDPLAIAKVGEPGKGSASVTSGKVRYVPASNATGLDTFTYTVRDDDGGSDTATVTVDIGGRNDLPVARDDTMTVDEDSGATSKNVVANDQDADGDPLTVVNVTQPGKGSVTFSGSNVMFTPNSNANGTTAFNYTVSDGNGGTDTATVTVTIRPVNDAPIAADDAMTVGEDSKATAKNVVANDKDEDGDGLTVSGVTQPSKGKVTFSGTSVSFTPNSNANGSTSFTYTVTDGNGASDTATVNVTITPVNDAPVARNDSMTIRKGYEQRDVFFNVISGAQGGGWTGSDSFSGGQDTDVDGDAMNYVGAANPSSGVSGVFVQCASSGRCQVRALNYVCGIVQFDWTYRVQDGQGASSNLATVTVRIEAQSCIR